MNIPIPQHAGRGGAVPDIRGIQCIRVFISFWVLFWERATKHVPEFGYLAIPHIPGIPYIFMGRNNHVGWVLNTKTAPNTEQVRLIAKHINAEKDEENEETHKLLMEGEGRPLCQGE